MDITAAAIAAIVAVVVVVVVVVVAVVVLVISINSSNNSRTSGMNGELQIEMFSVHYHNIFMASLVMTRKILGRSPDHLTRFKAGRIKADSQVACRAHAAPMPFPRHAVR